MDMFIYSIWNADFFSCIQFLWCHSFTMFKESKSNVIWLHRKIQHQDGESPIPKQNWASYKCLVRKSEKMCLS